MSSTLPLAMRRTYTLTHPQSTPSFVKSQPIAGRTIPRAARSSQPASSVNPAKRPSPPFSAVHPPSRTIHTNHPVPTPHAARQLTTRTHHNPSRARYLDVTSSTRHQRVNPSRVCMITTLIDHPNGSPSEHCEHSINVSMNMKCIQRSTHVHKKCTELVIDRTMCRRKTGVLVT